MGLIPTANAKIPYASWMVEKGVDLYHVKKLMGHSTLSMTERYSHLSDETLQGAVKLFEKGISKSKDSKSPTLSARDQSSD